MKRSFLIALCALLAACSNTKFSLPSMPSMSTPAAKPGAAPAAAALPAPAAAPTPATILADGIALYDKGDYNGAIRRLAVPSGPSAPKPIQLSALKYTAFSYCLTSRQTLCRQQFDKALKIDPGFDLEPGEKGHPLWGPVFLKAKKSKP